MAIGGEHKPATGRFQLLQRVEELLLHAWLPVQEVDIVDQQHIDPPQLGPKRREFMTAERGGEEVGELFCRQQQGLWPARLATEFGDDPLEQVCLARACAAKQIQRMPGWTGLRERPGRGESGCGVGPRDKIVQATKPPGDCDSPLGV